MMTLIINQIPEDHAEMTDWLDRQLVGVDLRQLAAELAACGPPQSPDADLASALGGNQPNVLRQGLGVLEPSQVRQLLSNPRLLLELQEQVLLEGEQYWQELDPADPQLDNRAAEGRDRVVQFLEGRRKTQRPKGNASAVLMPAVKPTRWYAHPVWVSLVTAATVLVALGVWDQNFRQAPQQAAVGWGWSKPGALDQQATAEQYLLNLAAAADQWFNKRPAEPKALAKRILTFREGCSTLILADHQPLSQEDQQWLVTKCQAWSAKLDQHLADLEAGKDLQQVLADADDTISKLATALRSRAAEV